MGHIGRTLAIVGAAIGLAACGTSHATVPAHIGRHEPATAYADHGRYSAYGAPTAAWDAAHAVDRDFVPASHAYDRDPAMALDDHHDGADYENVLFDAGRVVGYRVALRPESIAAARARVLTAELPRDARVLWLVRQGSACADMMVRSATLARLLGANRDGNPRGGVDVEFTSGTTASPPSYDPRAVTMATIFSSPIVSPAQAGGC